ncbi:MAG: FecR domain-containing protein [Dysgonamonadaceae bacterium]|jgi:ferric-dicitrate binding protein FerR (iron transport regulator)|nr:FecR domain-containing protein [Dysgonamonadaceae bacterium]
MKQTKLVDTGKAWENLQNRLTQENLIPENRKKLRLHSWNLTGAAVIIFCIFTGFGIYVLSDKSGNDLLSVTNEESGTSLVTTLEDGSTIYLTGNTSISYPEHFKTHERTVEIKGDALFEVIKDQERPFIVETEHVRIKVLGTAFRVNTNDKNSSSSFELSVIRGLVEVTGKSWGNPVPVAAGESVSLINGRLLKGNPKTDQFSKFNSRIRFKDENLDNILRVIKQTTGTNVILGSDDLKDLKLNVSFRNNSPDAMVKVICIALKLNYTSEDNTFYIYKP